MILVADSNTPTFSLGAKENAFTQYADAQGEVPFGEPMYLTGDVNKNRSQSYYSTTFGLWGTKNGTLDRQAVNVNIGDAMNVNGKPLADGKAHRHVFPIKPDSTGDNHWKWIDATVTASSKNASLIIHRVSASEQQPTNESMWDDFQDTKINLRHQSRPQHLSGSEYWIMTENHLVSSETANYRQSNKYLPLIFEQTSK